MGTCPKCGVGERVVGQAWCRGCLTGAQRERRARQSAVSGAGECSKCRRRGAEIRAAVEGAIEEHRRVVGDVALYGRAKVPWLVTRVLAALEG